MFWKSVSFFRSKSLSLVTKLMLFYSLSTIGILTAIGLFLYPTFVKTMQQLHGSQASYITAECFEKIIITLLLGSLSAVIFGHVIARNGLKRMREFEDKMEQITVDSLHERIHLEEWPKELKNFGKKFNMMLDRIQTSFIQLSQFSSDIAHELRTPIHNLRGMTEVALANEKYPDDYRRMLETYMNEYQHLSKLIENLLFLARSDHGQMVLKKEMINVEKEILNICDYYQAIADENEITLTCCGSATLFADPILFKRTISNLISNALNATKSQGKVSVAITTSEQWVMVSVNDTGIGLLPEAIPRIFDRFYRVDASRSSQSGGLGLGLAMVKAIVDLHQGKIAVESRVEQGTSIFLRLPSVS